MKKISVLVSLFVLSALILSACGANNGNNLGTPGTELTPGMTTPDDGVIVEETPTIDDGMGLATETMAAPVEPTATVGVDETTPEAEVPVTGDQQCVYNRLDNLLDYDVFDSANNQIGDVEGVLIQRDVAAVVDEDELEDNDAGDMTDTTPEAGDAMDVTATPATGTGDAGDAGAATASGAAPRVQYVIVDLEENDDDVLVPLAAFDLTAAAGNAADDMTDGDTADDATTADATAYPATEDEDALTEDATQDMDAVVDCGLMLTIDGAILTNAPVYDADALDLNAPGWDEEFSAYWTGQNLSIPATGAALGGTPALIDDEMSDVPVRNYNGDDLGEAEDFVFDAETGDLTYAIMASGGFLGLGERHFAVPVDRLQWAYEEAEDVNEIDELGYLLIDVDEETWENAPTIENLDDLDTSADSWDEEFAAFWNSLDGSMTE